MYVSTRHNIRSRDVHSGQSGRAAERVPRSGPLTNVRAAEPEPTLVRAGFLRMLER